MLGNFQEGREGESACRLQLGTSWWFLDTKEGMEWQINAFSNNLVCVVEERSVLADT